MLKMMKLREIWLREVIQPWMKGFWQYMKRALKVQYMWNAGIVVLSAYAICATVVTKRIKLGVLKRFLPERAKNSGKKVKSGII
jgi:hypothetical protein